MQASALRYSRWVAAAEKRPGWNRARSLERVGNAAGASAHLLGHCSVFAWHDEATTAVQLASHTVPEDSSIAMVPLPDGVVNAWWYFETPIELGHIAGEVLAFPEAGVAVDQTRLAAVLLSAHPFAGQPQPTLMVVVYRPTIVTLEDRGPRRLDMVPTLVNLVEVENTVAQIRAHRTDKPPEGVMLLDNFARLFQFVIAGCAWLDQKIAAVRHDRIERHARKRIAREFEVEAPTEVRVISLRRQESAPHEAGEGRVVDWRYRWVVSGHWRKQAVKDGHRLTYINPYMKGPADRPLKLPTATVYDVSR
jgi:hypothetical protein